ncbi:cytochrome P450 [Agrocybe pediades]|nr:cytochrome P450 [Agrocybe pediades]
MITPLICILALSVVLWGRVKRRTTFSTLDNVPGPKPKSWWKGSFDDVFNARAWDFHWDIAKKYGSVIKIPTFMGDNWLYIFDPKALHHILVKEQYVFEETSSFVEGNKLLFGPGLVATLGEQHRKQRKMLNPVFSMAYMRDIAPTFYAIAYKLRNSLARKVNDGPQEVDVLHWMGRTALELIGQSGLGVSFDSLEEDSNPHKFAVAAKSLMPAIFKFTFVRNYFLSTMLKIGPPKFRRFIVDLIPSSWTASHDLKNIIDVMHSTSIELYETKKKAFATGDYSEMERAGAGKDIISILMKANMEVGKDDALTEEEVIGQMSTLIFAATDTTSSALSRVLQLLSQHKDIQEKLRREITEATEEGDLSHDQLVSLPYLDAVCRETLRLYPPVSVLVRTSRRDAVIPLSKPIKGLDGQMIHEIPVPNNTNIIVGIMAANRNPELWGEDADEWKPERWLSPLPEALSEAHLPGVYSNLMTFLGGGRACIGFKFAQLEMKVLLMVLVKSFRFHPSKEIRWQMFNIAMPTVAEEEASSIMGRLPLIIERIDAVSS